jgi:hypothetical protein
MHGNGTWAPAVSVAAGPAYRFTRGQGERVGDRHRFVYPSALLIPTSSPPSNSSTRSLHRSDARPSSWWNR